MFGRGKLKDDPPDIDPREFTKISGSLDEGEQVLMAVRQSRVKPGGAAILTPNTIFVTEKRIVIRNPTKMGLGENIEDYPYDQITSVKLEKGMFSASIQFTIPGMTEESKSGKGLRDFGLGYVPWNRNDEGVIDAIPKDKAEKLFKIIREGVQKAKNAKSRTQITQQQTPLDRLKMKYVNGEITEEEFERKRKVLES